MTQGRPMPEVLAELKKQNEAKQDFIGPAQAFTLEPDGRTFGICFKIGRNTSRYLFYD